MNSLAAVLKGLSRPLEIMELEISPLDCGQVLVEFEYSGVCRSQLMEVSGARGEDKWIPHLLGHEGVGVVLDIGPGVKHAKIGDTVVVGWLETRGIDAQPASYLNKKTGEKINSGKAVTFATKAIVSENRVFSKPKSISNKEAVLLGCALPTGAGMVLNETSPNSKDKILIIGLGGIGLSVLITLLMKGLSNISILEPNKSKLDLAKSLGVKGFLAEKRDDFDSRNQFDLCYESSGRTSGIETGFDLINNAGTLVFASHPPTGEFINLDPHELIQGKKIIGSWGGGGQPEETARKIEKLDNHNYLGKLLGREYSLFEINDALNDLKSGKSLRPIINFRSCQKIGK